MDYLYNNGNGTSTTGSGTSGFRTDWAGLGGNIFSGITTYFGSVENRKAMQEQAKALIAQGKSQEEVARIMQETERLKLEQAKLGGGQGGLNPTVLIGLGVGAVVILGVVIFAVTRKKA